MHSTGEHDRPGGADEGMEVECVGGGSRVVEVERGVGVRAG
jgi:hypothetical protein